MSGTKAGKGREGGEGKEEREENVRGRAKRYLDPEAR